MTDDDIDAVRRELAQAHSIELLLQPLAALQLISILQFALTFTEVLTPDQQQFAQKLAEAVVGAFGDDAPTVRRWVADGWAEVEADRNRLRTIN